LQSSLSDSHCGAGCALGDVIGKWIVWATAWTIGSVAAAALGPEYILDLGQCSGMTCEPG
jgi:Domain of unknown function (DUF4396)